MLSPWAVALVVALASALPAKDARPPASPADAKGLCKKGPPLLVPDQVAGVPLDPHYAAMFAVGNRFEHEHRYGPASGSGRKRQVWREDCEVARVDAAQGGLVAIWVCHRSDRAQLIRRSIHATSEGVRPSGYWPCDWLANQIAVTRPPRKGKGMKGDAEGIHFDWQRKAVQVKAPSGRMVQGFAVECSGGNGAGTDCDATYAHGLGLVDWGSMFGGDDTLTETLGGQLVDCSGPRPVP